MLLVSGAIIVVVEYFITYIIVVIVPLEFSPAHCCNSTVGSIIQGQWLILSLKALRGQHKMLCKMGPKYSAHFVCVLDIRVFDF